MRSTDPPTVTKVLTPLSHSTRVAALLAAASISTPMPGGVLDLFAHRFGAVNESRARASEAQASTARETATSDKPCHLKG